MIITCVPRRTGLCLCAYAGDAVGLEGKPLTVPLKDIQDDLLTAVLSMVVPKYQKFWSEYGRYRSDGNC